jgi:acyl-CoA thioesterase FadM
MILEFPIRLPRHAFSPRNAARAGDVWRAFQEIATEGSSRVGWSPDRYHRAGIGFIVRQMTTVHHRETSHGEALTARTWVKDFKRGMITTREIRVVSESGPVASTSQEWVHVRMDHDRAAAGEPPIRPARAAPELVACFEMADPEPSPALPDFSPVEGARVHELTFRAWHTWMDPLGHANHPAYVDWADEATSHALAAVGLDPMGLVPVAEHVTWKTGVMAPDQVTVRTRLIGLTASGDAVLSHEILRNGSPSATATTIRRLVGGGDALITALR